MRPLLLAAVAVLLLLVFWLVPAISQDPAYHLFADTRRFFAVPNFWNVMSNVPFLFAGIYGLLHLNDLNPELRMLLKVYSGGLILVCFGSSWYHLAPDNPSLVWDRLSMTISFVTFFAFVMGAVTSLQFALRILWPLIGVGFFSVIYWITTEQAGAGDLRPYAVVQFLPCLIIPALLMICPQRFSSASRRWMWLGVAAYVAAKLAEWQDLSIYSASSLLSGHSIKHVLAALSSYYFVRALLAANEKAIESENER